MRFATFLEAAEESKRQLAYKLQQQLIELLPDDYDVTVTNLFLSAGQYNYGSIAVKVKHPSYNGVIANGQVLIFPHQRSSKLIYVYKQDYERAVEYTDLQELAADLQDSILKNSV